MCGTPLSRPEDSASESQSVSIYNQLSLKELHKVFQAGVVALPLPWDGVRYDSGSSMKHLAVLLAGLAFSTATLEAQGSPGGVPDSHRPPPGMCRIWIEGVPPAHQPAPTDCATAIRKRPANARVVFGNEPAGAERGFAPSRATPAVAPPPTPLVVPNNQPNPQSHEELDRAARLREEQDRQRNAQQRSEDEKRARRTPDTHHDTHPNNPPPHQRTERPSSRPPSHSFSTHRPR